MDLDIVLKIQLLERRDARIRTEALKEAADRNCFVCEGYYEKTLCGGTRQCPYRPDHCQFRHAILGETKVQQEPDGMC